MHEFNYKYRLECPSCETKIEMEIFDLDEFPVYCPMCGEDVNEDYKSDDID